MGVIPKPIGTEMGAEFFVYPPEGKYLKKEEPGIMDSKATGLSFILANDSFFREQPLEAAFEGFLKHLWQKAQLNTNLPQRVGFLAQHRPARDWVQPPHATSVTPVNPQVPYGTPLVDEQYLRGLARDWEGMLRIKRVVAYTFRGDSRSPEDVYKKYDGFHPNSTRIDETYIYGKVFEAFKAYVKRRNFREPSLDEYKEALAKKMSDPNTRRLYVEYVTWRMLLKEEEMHLGRMVADELLKGYISTSKSVTVAKGFAKSYKGWVYVLRIDGGYEVPEKGKDVWTKIFGEQEIAYPGAVPWVKVQGYRKVDPVSGLFTGNIALRAIFTTVDLTAAEQVYKILSGKPQKEAKE